MVWYAVLKQCHRLGFGYSVVRYMTLEEGSKPQPAHWAGLVQLTIPQALQEKFLSPSIYCNFFLLEVFHESIC